MRVQSSGFRVQGSGFLVLVSNFWFLVQSAGVGNNSYESQPKIRDYQRRNEKPETRNQKR